ncbi:MAG: MFS transporter [Persephonella sp.]|nr:MFS transporter [Persephonella sp.]
MVFAVLPFFLVNSVGVSMVIIGLIEGGYNLVSNFLKIFSGYWSDFFSKKKNSDCWYFVFHLFKTVFYLWKKWGDFLIGALLEGGSEGIQVSVSDTVLSSQKKDLGKIFGVNRAIESTGSFLGIIIAFIYTAFFLSEIEYQSYFLLSIIPVFLAFLAVLFLKEDKKLRKYPIPIVSWEIFSLNILFFVLSFANFGYSFYILKVYESILSEYKTIGIYILSSVIIAVASYLSGRFND